MDLRNTADFDNLNTNNILHYHFTLGQISHIHFTFIFIFLLLTKQTLLIKEQQLYQLKDKNRKSYLMLIRLIDLMKNTTLHTVIQGHLFICRWTLRT